MATQTKVTTADPDNKSMPDLSSLNSNIQHLEWWYNTWSKIGLALGVMTAVFGVLSAAAGAAAYWYSVKLKPEQDALTQAKEELVALDLKHKEGQIAATKNETARVDAESREKAAALTKEAEALKADAEKARANIAAAQADAARADERTQKLAIEAADARRRQAEAERSLLELQERVKARGLTAKQRTALIQELRRFPPQTISISVLSDPEAGPYGEQLADAFANAGWEIQVIRTGSMSPPPFGLIIQIADPTNPPAPMKILISAFAKAGIDVSVEQSGFNRLIVGMKSVLK